MLKNLDIEQLDIELLEGLFYDLSDIVMIFDNHLNVRFMNETARRLLMLEHNYCESKVFSLEDLLTQSMMTQLEDKIKSVLNGHIIEENLLFGENEESPYRVVAKPIGLNHNTVSGIFVVASSTDAILSDHHSFDKMLNLEKIVSEISSKFISFESMSDAINDSLKLIAQFSMADRAYVFEFNFIDQTMNNTYEWCQDGVEPEIDNLLGLPLSTFPWWMKQLDDGQVIYVADVKDMPIEAVAEKEILEFQAIKSVLVLPVVYDKKCRGFLGFDHTKQTQTWDDYDFSLLKLISEVFSSAFNKIENERKILDSYQKLEVMYDDLRRKEMKLVQQEQMVAIGQLAAGVAHEINNPLGYSISNVATMSNMAEAFEEMLMKTFSDDDKADWEIMGEEIEEAKELIEDVLEGLTRVSDIVKGLSFFAHSAENNEIVAYDINEGIRNTLIVSESQYEDYAHIETLLDQVPMLYCHASAINQVLLHLVLNSVDAIKEKELHPSKGHLKIETYAEKKAVICKVTDDGVGIPNALGQQVFNPFFTTKPEGKGTGLGLSIAYDIIVNQHKGVIEFESEEGIGTSFTFKLPL